MNSSSEKIIPPKESRKMSDNQAVLMNLPPEIILDILSRLPIPSIIRCKCVCRQLLELITSTDFAELHLPRSTPGLIIHHLQTDENSEMGQDLCKIFEVEDEVEFQHRDLHYKQLMEFNPRSIITDPDARIRMEGSSVNGLLCWHDTSSQLDAFYICNPITHEYIALPGPPEEVRNPDSAKEEYGFGVSSSTGEYKLVRIRQGWSVTSSGESSSRNFPDLKCAIYTLGTGGSWRSITLGATFQLDLYRGHAFLSGNLHWLAYDAERSSIIACFNLETELLHSFPPLPFSIHVPDDGSLVSLGDCLCVCDNSKDEEFVVWVMMKEYGVGESWTKEYVISKQDRPYDVIWPLKVFKDGGDVLFVVEDESLFLDEESIICYYCRETETVYDVRAVTDQIVAMPYTPSLVSLKRFEMENVASF